LAPVPATETPRVGTSGYAYQDWIGPLYPEGTRPDMMLSVYASRFDAVELNYTYYRMPEAAPLAKLAARAAAANPRFLFAVKAHRTLTHEIGPQWQADADAFAEALSGLRAVPAPAAAPEALDFSADVPGAGGPAGRPPPAPRPEAPPQNLLAAVLAQFPHSFHYTLQNRRHLASLLDRWKDLPVAVEFRSAEWIRDRVIAELRARDVALAGVDEPDIEGLPPRRAWPGTTLGYVRFHGRNRDQWWRGDSASRYDYEYSDAELREWLPRLMELMAHARRTLAFFNNHWKGKATKNAAMLDRLLRGGC